MSSTIPSYLRTHRKRSGLTQDELADLLGLKSGQTVSRYECLKRSPSLETAFACQILFGAKAHEIYPGLYAKVEKITLRRIRTLRKRLRSDADNAMSVRKREILAQAMKWIRSRRSRL